MTSAIPFTDLAASDRPLQPGECAALAERAAGLLDPAALECTVENRLPGGDHEIVVGRVQDVEINHDSAGPLLYWRGSYLPLGEGMSA